MNDILETANSILCKGSLLSLENPLVMGILNLTPDSFSDGGKYNQIDKALTRAGEMLEDGADIIDIGAFSSRPGAKFISVSEEKLRLKYILKEITRTYPKAILSLDTFRSEIAKWAVQDLGVAIINDISAGEMDKDMFETVANLQVPYIIMHMQGKPDNMQVNPHYEDVTRDIILYFTRKLERLKELAVHDVIIDPGFGFGKTLENNYQLLKELDHFKVLEKAILVGLSRKSMIQKVLEVDASETLNGTTVLNTLAIEKGADILRVHDVKEAKELVRLRSQL